MYYNYDSHLFQKSMNAYTLCRQRGNPFIRLSAIECASFALEVFVLLLGFVPMGERVVSER